MKTLALALLACSSLAAQNRIEIKVVVVTMFELGQDEGDAPGELQLWVEREKLTKVLPFPAGVHPLRSDGKGMVALLTGVGTAKAAASVMALGLDQRFDLTKAYWLIAGIAGVDPADASLGSAVWAQFIVDGDLAHEIDAREIPADWKTGYVPLRKSVPYETPRKEPSDGELYSLNPKLVDWAFRLTRPIELSDTAALKQRRGLMTGFPTAQRAPFVLKGDTLQSATFWHGKLLNAWANDWVAYFTKGAGNYVTTAMEDAGTMQSLTLLGRSGRVDIDRVLVLRTASNFDSQRPGITAAESLAENKAGNLPGFLPAVENAWKAGSLVARHLIANWRETRAESARVGRTSCTKFLAASVPAIMSWISAAGRVVSGCMRQGPA